MSTYLKVKAAIQAENKPTALLCTSLELLGESNDVDEATKIVRAAISDTLFDRHPEVLAAVDRWIDADSEETMSQVIIKASLAAVANQG